MEGFFQAAGAVMIAVVLCLTVGSQNRSFSVVLAMLVCALVMLLGLQYLQPVMDFLEELQSIGNLSADMVIILLKTAVIGILSEVAALLCTDSGNRDTATVLTDDYQIRSIKQ